MCASEEADLAPLVKALIWYDKNSRLDRAKRIVWSSSLYQSPGIIIGSIVPLHLMEETRISFVNGQFMVVVLSAMSVIEHLLMDELAERGVVIEKIRTLSEAIKRAREIEALPQPMLDRADRLRKLRNPMVHKNADVGEYSLYERYRKHKVAPATVLEGDAREALCLMYEIFLHVLKYAA